MTLGFGIYYTAKALSKKFKDVSAGKKVMLTMAELILLLLMLLNIYRGVGGYDEVASVYIAAGMLTLALSGMTYTNKVNAGLFSYLGKLSIPIYCVHWGVYKWVSCYRCGTGYLAAVLVTIIISMVISVILMAIVDKAAAKESK